MLRRMFGSGSGKGSGGGSRDRARRSVSGSSGGAGDHGSRCRDGGIDICIYLLYFYVNVKFIFMLFIMLSIMY